MRGGMDRGMQKKALIALGVTSLGLVVACCIVALGAGSHLRRTELAAAQDHFVSARQRSVLAEGIARQLEQDAGRRMPRRMALTAGKAYSSILAMCGAGAGKNAASMDRYRKRADANWWAAIKAFATQDEVKQAVMSDPRHVHLLVFVAPGWCHWSQKQLQELQANFDDLGEAQSRVHLIDVDDPANKELVQFQGVTSFPTIVVVQGNNILGKANGYKDFDTVHDIAFVDTAGVPFDQSFPGA